jgi:ABC-type polysaccharide/polyol phosphate transport system ATPase subunit
MPVQPIVRCRNVSKRFHWHDRNLSLKKGLTQVFKPDHEAGTWQLFSDLSFDVARGERIGFIGRNGCGKTTLLRLIAGIYPPSSGTIEVHSQRVLALLELGVGFYPDLTGTENIRLNWVFNGLRLQELAQKFQRIVDFSGVGKFLETPLKYYSSGMKARLGFAIASHADPDLLIVDEVLAVGDSEFQAKCRTRIRELCSSGTTLLLVSHNPQDVTEICGRAIWIEKGTIAYDGDPATAIDMYAGGRS